MIGKYLVVAGCEEVCWLVEGHVAMTVLGSLDSLAGLEARIAIDDPSCHRLDKIV